MKYKPESVAALQVAIGGHCPLQCMSRRIETSAYRQKRLASFAK
jgi:hypothetical protein